MPADVRQMLQRAAARDDLGADAVAILDRADRLRRRRRAVRGALVVIAPVAMIVATLASGSLWERVGLMPGTAGAPRSDVLDVPSVREEVAPAFLADGSPVFVVNLGEHGVRVLDARSPSTPYGKIGVLVGWCRSSGRFEDLAVGNRFLPEGYWLDGPAPTGLGSYEIERLRDSPVRVGAQLPAPQRAETPDIATSVETRGPGCWDHPASVMSPERDPAVAQSWLERLNGHFVDRAMTPDGGVHAPVASEALAAAVDGQVLVYGALEVRGSSAHLCDPSQISDRDSSPPGRECPAEHSFAVDVELPEDAVHGWQGLIIADVEGGELVGATLTTAIVEYYG